MLKQTSFNFKTSHFLCSISHHYATDLYNIISCVHIMTIWGRKAEWLMCVCVRACGWVTLRHEHAEQNGRSVARGTNENPPTLSSRYLCIENTTQAAILTSTPGAHPLRTIESIMEGITWETKDCLGSLARQAIALGWYVLHLSTSFLKASQKEDTVGCNSTGQRDAGVWPTYKPKILTLQP